MITSNRSMTCNQIKISPYQYDEEKHVVEILQPTNKTMDFIVDWHCSTDVLILVRSYNTEPFLQWNCTNKYITKYDDGGTERKGKPWEKNLPQRCLTKFLDRNNPTGNRLSIIRSKFGVQYQQTILLVTRFPFFFPYHHVVNIILAHLFDSTTTNLITVDVIHRPNWRRTKRKKKKKEKQKKERTKRCTRSLVCFISSTLNFYLSC